MDKHTLTSNYFETIEMLATNDRWVISSSAVIAARAGVGIDCDIALTGNRISIAGTVTGKEGGMLATAERTVLSIEATGTIFGIVDFGGEGSSIDNAGHVISTNYGIAAEGGGIRLRNTGTIAAGEVGIFADALEGAFVNGKTGVISAGDTGIRVSGDEGAKQRIVNEGRIDAGSIAIEAGSANETVINTGKITGDVELGSGDDVFDTRHGTFKGALHGEGGNDTLITDSAKVHLLEDAVISFDTVKSTVSYTLDANVERLILLGTRDLDGAGSETSNTLTGNVGNNVLKGMAGLDTLDGGKGNDRLFGGAGNDTFGFASGYGKDEIADFAAGDKVYLHNWSAIDDFNQLRSHAANHGADVWITAGSDTLILDHMHRADLQPGDFTF